MNTTNWDKDSFYQAMCNSVDGYVFICTHPVSGYEVTVSEEFVREFDLPQDYKNHYFDLWLERIHTEDREKYKSSLKSMFENKTRKFCLQYRVLNCDKKWVWIESRAYLSFDENGSPVMLAGIIRYLGRQYQLDHTTGFLN